MSNSCLEEFVLNALFDSNYEWMVECVIIHTIYSSITISCGKNNVFQLGKNDKISRGKTENVESVNKDKTNNYKIILCLMKKHNRSAYILLPRFYHVFLNSLSCMFDWLIVRKISNFAIENSTTSSYPIALKLSTGLYSRWQYNIIVNLSGISGYLKHNNWKIF